MALRSYGLIDVLRRNAAISGRRAAFIFEGQTITHADHLARVERLAAALSAIGVKPGDRIAIIADNSPDFIAAYGAAAWLGAILVPVNWRLSADEIAWIIGDAAPLVVLASIGRQEELRASRPEYASVRRWIGIGASTPPFDNLSELIESAGAAPAPQPDDGPFVIIHTAAVGGRPRGALLTQAGLLANSMQAIAAWNVTPDDVAYLPLPLFHVAGLNLLLTGLHAGACAVVAQKFEARQAAAQIAAHQATLFVEFAPMLGQLLDTAAGDASLASLRVVSGLDTPETIGRFEAACPAARFYAAFGQTETSGFVTMAAWRNRPGSAGLPMFMNAVAVVDESDRPLPAGETGEIVVRGPGVFGGYWNLPDDTASTFRNGWHHTGDTGAFDADGYLFYKGRSAAKELIKPGGENVYPAEVEAALKAHPAVEEAIVFGVADKDWGEAVKAVCALHAGARATPDEIVAFVAGRIARYKRPKHLVLADALPRKPDGTPDRAKVKIDFA
ncbi:MAG TPA: AMP-binding protein [Rhodoblastus sp.]|nr:AMP-binding protein [Rhodoblastus sp.]